MASDYRAKVLSCKPLNEDVYHVRLEAPENKSFEYSAGQYLFIKMAEDDTRPYSIASPPGDGSTLEMHIRDIPGNDFCTQVLERLKTQSHIDVMLPEGACTLARASGERPLLFIAGGTGFAPFNAMIQQALAENFSKAIELYWGAKTEEDLYLLNEVRSWSASQFNFNPVVQEPSSDWQGMTGFVHEAAFANNDDLTAYDIFIGGSSAMVFNVYRQLRARQVPGTQIFSDMLDILRDTGELTD